MEKIFKLYGTDKTIENTAVMRTHLDDEKNVYSSIFGFYPTINCSFSISYNGRNDRLKKVESLYNKLIADGFTNFFVGYSNTNENDMFDDHEEEIILNDIFITGFIVFNDECLISFGNNWPGIDIFTHKNKDIIKSVVDKYLLDYVGDNNKVMCNIIAHSHDFYMEPFEIKLKWDLDFGLYNEGFKEINEEIVRSIKEDDNGLYILHGEAGTGKTTYIRHLIKQLKNNKKFVYIPSNLVNNITSPQFLSFLMSNRNCVFVIEDCENLVVTKNNTRSSAVADMLNMSDGLLADALNIKFICTFNTNEKNIDSALLRPGRCRMKYDFGKLKKERAIEAAKRLGLKEPDKDISLAELFSGENKFVEEEKKIGF